MVAFSKMMDRGKFAGSDQGGEASAMGGQSRGIFLKRRQSQNSAGWDQEVSAREKQAVIERRKVLHSQAAEYLRLVTRFIQADKSFSLEPGMKLLEKIVDTRTPIDALFLKAIHDEDSYDLMVSPSVNVAIYAIKMAETLGFSKTRQVEIGMVGLLHDIGMAKIPEALVYKETLTSDEFLVFKARPSYGYEILKVFKREYAYLAECALQIHERIDGSGYPRGLYADEIHEYAQIIGLVDIYEALIHSRPQREKIPHFYAVKEIIKTGKDKFQQRFLKALLNTFSIFPLNSYVRLNSGAIGRVIRTYPDQPMRPEIQVIYDSQSKRVLTERLINLPEHALLYIVDSVSEEDLVEIGETSYLVVKSGRNQAAFPEDENDTEIQNGVDSEPVGAVDAASDSIVESNTDVDAEADFDRDTRLEGPDKQQDEPAAGKPTRRLTEARAAKPENRWLKKRLLLLAILLLAAGLVWQLPAGTFVANRQKDQVSVDMRRSEKAKPGSFDKGVALSREIAPPVDAAARLSAKIENEKPEQLSADEVPITVKHDSQEEDAVAAPQATPELSVAVDPKAVAPDETDQSPTGAGQRTPVEKQAVFVAPPQSGRYPYAIHLASFTKLSEAKTAIAQYRAMGLDPFWVKVDLGVKGQWFRVFNGYYRDRALARADIERHSLKKASVKPTRYATWVAGFLDNQVLAEKRAELEDMGFSTYVMPGSLGARQLFIGAFYTLAGAQTQHTALASAGIESRIVER